MTSVPSSSWKVISGNAITQLTPAERSRCLRLQSARDVEALLRSIKISPNSAGIEPILPRLDAIVQVSSPLQDVAYELSERQSAVSVAIWNFLGLAIKCTAGEVESLEIAAKTYEDLLAHMPWLSSSTAIDAKSPNAMLAVLGVYQEYVSLGLRIIKVFGRSTGSISIVTKLRWKRDQKDFYKTLRKLKRLKELAAQEVGAVNADDEKHWRDAMLAAVTGTDSASTAPSMELASLSLSVVRFPQFLVPRRSATFVGRLEQMRLLEAGLGLEGTAERRLRIVVIHGLGGVGKTQLAIEFSHRNRSRYDACYWVSADTPVKLAKGFDDVARKIQVREVDHAQIRTRVKEWLSDTDRSWLLVFDNAEEPQDLVDYIPASASGSILITSRSRNWVHQDFVDLPIFLESFSDADGVSMFQSTIQRYSRAIDVNTALNIVREVGGLPLAIRQIACYIATTHANAEEFLQRYEAHEENARRAESYTLTGLNVESQSLATVWDLTLSKLSPSSVFLLNVMVMLDPDSIPTNLFADDVTSDASQPYIRTLEQYESAVDDLQRYSLLLLSSKNNDQVLNIHRQVRRNVLNKLNTTTLQEAFQWVLNKLRKEFPHQSPLAEPLSRSWKKCEAWISHLISANTVASSFGFTAGLPEPLAELLIDGAIYLWERGLLHQAHQLVTSARTVCEGEDCDLKLLAEVHSFQGCILSDLGKTDEAKSCFVQEVELKRRYLQDLSRNRKKPSMTDEIQLANAYNNLAGILCTIHDFKEADINNQLSLAIKERWKGKHDLDYLLSLSYSNFGNLFGLQGRWNEAANWYQKALDIPEEKHYMPRRALIYHNFGSMRLSQHLLKEATELLTEAVQLRTETLGDHYDTVNSLHALASCYQQSGELVEARDLLQEALRMLDSQHLRDPRRIARTKFLLSLILERLKDPAASSMRQAARDLKEQLTGRSTTDFEMEEDYDELVPYV